MRWMAMRSAMRITASNFTSFQSRICAMTRTPVSSYRTRCCSRIHGTSGSCRARDGTRSWCTSAADAEPTVAAETEVDVDPYVMDIRVGRIIKCWKHPEADSLYVEEVDVGVDEPRQICSGLVAFVPLEAMEGAGVTVLCNLKPRKMRGVMSQGMLLCASNDEHDKVELLSPPEGAPAGERVLLGEADEALRSAGADEGGEDGEDTAGVGVRDPETPNRVQKKKLWEAVQPHLRTDGECVAQYKGKSLMTSAGAIRAATLAGAGIS